MKFYKSLSLFYKSLSPLAKIYFSTIAFVVYIALIIVPFLMLYAPANENTVERGFSLAPFIYLLLFLSAFIVYLVAIIKNIGKIEKKRFIAYPTFYIMLFISLHMLIISISPILLRIMIGTIPIGLFGLCIIEIVAIILDIKGKKSLNKIDKLDVSEVDGKQEVKSEQEGLEKEKNIQEKSDKKVYKIFYRILGTILILIVCERIYSRYLYLNY